MSAQQLINAKVEIGGQIIPLKINVEEEEFVRQAGKMINGKINELQTQFAVTDVKVALSIVALDAVAELLKLSQSGQSDNESLDKALSDIESILA